MNFLASFSTITLFPGKKKKKKKKKKKNIGINGLKILNLKIVWKDSITLSFHTQNSIHHPYPHGILTKTKKKKKIK